MVYIHIVNIAWLLCVTKAEMTVDRSDENLITFPNNINTDVTTLMLSGNNITRIENNSVASLTALEKLKLNNNGVEFISTNAFVNNTHLADLELQGHRLSTIPPELGGAWKTLVRFGFGRGRLSIPAVHMENFTALTMINMNFFYTKSFILRNLPSLKQLYAQNCKLQEFPDLAEAPKLETVQLHQNDFTWVPSWALAGLSKLRYLMLPESRVMHLPDLSHLASLKTIHVNGNALKTIPDMYDQMITKINLANNPLVCDKVLCWIRMWDYIKYPLDVNSYQKGTCAKPTHMRGLLMDVHPVEMKCYKGKPPQTTATQHNI